MSVNISAGPVQAAMERVSEAALKVSQGPVAPGFAASVVDMKAAQRDVEAAVQVVRTESEVLGYLIDELV
ncbi:hypothetical protein [Wenzhouxiangella limi]|uniref:Uncharacterized protein n=1 Tax=Wenzhouxiangella limi TaxID=2707351 RepID=A0A845UTP5_9GAMM|nr:hypothetical protein [Wenzhouxiangella limi]NDY95193.1 hypothetical protein [Wenzhouxiangella limi]